MFFTSKLSQKMLYHTQNFIIGYYFGGLGTRKYLEHQRNSSRRTIKIAKKRRWIKERQGTNDRNWKQSRRVEQRRIIIFFIKNKVYLNKANIEADLRSFTRASHAFALRDWKYFHFSVLSLRRCSRSASNFSCLFSAKAWASRRAR